MLTLRLTVAAPPLALLLRLLLLGASMGIGLLLLATLSYALDHPTDRATALLRLLWCTVPLAVTAQLAAALGRTEPRAAARSGLDAAGLGPARLPLLAARTTAAPAMAGSALALLVTERAVGTAGTDGTAHGPGLPGLPSTTAGLPLTGQPLPVPAVVTLLSTVPLLAALAAAWGARAGAPGTVGGTDGARGVAVPAEAALTAGATATRGTAPAGAKRGTKGAGGAHGTGLRVAAQSCWAWLRRGSPAAGPRDGTGALHRGELLCAAVLAAGGLLLAAFTARAAAADGSAHSEGWAVRAEDIAASPLAVGWLLAAVGLMLAGPGVTALSGRLLGSVRPGPVRLLAGRSLVREAAVVGRPLGGLSAVGAALIALARARLAGDGTPALGPLVVLAAVLTGCCVAGAVLAALARARAARAPLRELLDRIGAPRRSARAVTLLRGSVTTAAFAALAAATGLFAALPPR
ncbi:hypothetical protein ITI46_26510 [Streptomyces oryzae]|uniref:Integral membrane protein n=1 Tax=Streptomyces oryzae TaxID=1434886 RepID=A0ABS3XIF5_9ACTN|nr:hypothetical protein [Streptomyces oryzae]MBO8195176.1 hypothetical protein [Streptomyces oryzae]